MSASLLRWILWRPHLCRRVPERTCRVSGTGAGCLGPSPSPKAGKGQPCSPPPRRLLRPKAQGVQDLRTQCERVMMLVLCVNSWWGEPCFSLPVCKVWFYSLFQWNQPRPYQWAPFTNPATGKGISPTLLLSVWFCVFDRYVHFSVCKGVRQMYAKSTWTSVLKFFCWEKLQGDYKTQRI